MKYTFIPRDVSWLSFNARVLQEAADETVPLSERIKFLGIHSNNLDEFFRVRVASLRRIIELGEKNKYVRNKKETSKYLKDATEELEQIQSIVIDQQTEFARIWHTIEKELAKEKVFFKTDTDLSKEQQVYVEKFFDEVVESNVIPLLVDYQRPCPYLRDKSLYLGVVMRRKTKAYEQRFALIEIPVSAVGRFVLLPAKEGEINIILLENIIKYNLKYIFSFLGYDTFEAHIFKLTKDADFDVDNDINTTLVEKIEKGIKNRRKGKPVRFIYDKEMDASLLNFLIKKLNLSNKDNIIPGGKIHNFRHFMDFPKVLKSESERKNTAFMHPAFVEKDRVTDIILKKDVLLSTPYHSFLPIIHLLREAAMDPDVLSIRITAYRLASNSKIVNALINAVRNGKKVTVMLELKARFDEEANLIWKEKLEEEGVKVLVGIPNKKVHAKICVIKKRISKGKIVQYGFVSTGNLNEKTAKIYGDHTLMTANRRVMADINKIFDYIERHKKIPIEVLHQCSTLMVCPTGMRNKLLELINNEIKNAKNKKKAKIIVKINSLSDKTLIERLYQAAIEGVEVKLIVRGIFCADLNQSKVKGKITAISIVDEYLEHARVLIFHNGGKEKVFISSADWMVRNLDHRIEAAIEITDKNIRTELIDIVNIQLSDNVKARKLASGHLNKYVTTKDKNKIRAQLEIYNYLLKKLEKKNI